MSNASPRPSAGNLQTGARVALFGVGVNVVMAAGKLTAGVFGHSYALLADGMESALDVASSAILWSGLKYAAKPADAQHPYGHGKAEPVAAIIVALGVMGAALLLAIDSVRVIQSPREAPALFTVPVLLAIIATKEFLYHFIRRIGERTDSNAVRADALHHRSDAVTSVVALIGISIARLGGERFASADGWVALGACGWIAYNGFRIFLPSLQDLLDAAPSAEMVEAVTRTALGVPGVRAIDQIRMRKMGLDFYVDLHLEVDGSISVREGHQIAHRVKDAIRAAHSAVEDVLVHVEPAS